MAELVDYYWLVGALGTWFAILGFLEAEQLSQCRAVQWLVVNHLCLAGCGALGTTLRGREVASRYWVRKQSGLTDHCTSDDQP
ncbi:hypothetical protein BJX66DRAFT_315698 [Aspergillus keveii]|uniref:TMhelix containing protein n=1 Tax=Aspergillus keveii TaxID=714993 RepID=A0ABR4FP54_9EURO